MADESQVTPEEGSRLRKMNEDLLKENRELKEANAVRDSGYEHLTPRQRKIVLRELHDDKLDLTSENLEKVAKELGYEKPDEKPPETNTTTTTDADDPNHQPTAEELRRHAMARMQGMTDAMASGSTDPGGEVTKENFNEKMRAIDDPEKLMEFIQVHGHVGGIMDEAQTY